MWAGGWNPPIIRLTLNNSIFPDFVCDRSGRPNVRDTEAELTVPDRCAGAEAEAEGDLFRNCDGVPQIAKLIILRTVHSREETGEEV